MDKIEYCLIIEDKDTDKHIEIKKDNIFELTEIINYLDFVNKVRSIKIFRSDNL